MMMDEGHDECVDASSCLSNTAIVAAADGEMDAQTRAHIQECPCCAAKVRQMRHMQKRLRQQLYRLFCPTTDVLIDYCQGLLEPRQLAIISHHLATCPYCAAEVALMESLEPVPDLVAPRSEAFFALRHTR